MSTPSPSLSRRASRIGRSTRVLSAAALGVLLLASCGRGTSAGAAAGGPVVDAAPVAVSAPATSGVTATAGTLTVKALATRVGTALENVRSGTATTTVVGRGAPAESVRITADAAAPAALVTAHVTGQTYEVRALKGAVYVSGPALQVLTGGKTWARADVATLTQLAGPAARPTAAPSVVPDPTRVGGLVSQAVSVRDLGTATVNGTAGHTYRVTLPVAAIAQLTSETGLPLDAKQRAQLRQGVDALAAQGVTVLSSDLTLDSRNRPLQLTTSTPALAGGITPMRITTVFSGWGAPLELTAPPASQVKVLTAQELTALGGTLAASAGQAAPSTPR